VDPDDDTVWPHVILIVAALLFIAGVLRKWWLI